MPSRGVIVRVPPPAPASDYRYCCALSQVPRHPLCRPRRGCISGASRRGRRAPGMGHQAPCHRLSHGHDPSRRPRRLFVAHQWWPLSSPALRRPLCRRCADCCPPTCRALRRGGVARCRTAGLCLLATGFDERTGWNRSGSPVALLGRQTLRHHTGAPLLHAGRPATIDNSAWDWVGASVDQGFLVAMLLARHDSARYVRCSG